MSNKFFVGETYYASNPDTRTVYEYKIFRHTPSRVWILSVTGKMTEKMVRVHEEVEHFYPEQKEITVWADRRGEECQIIQKYKNKITGTTRRGE